MEFIEPDQYSLACKISDLLNSAFKADPEAVTKMVLGRVSCNRALADHPLIQVRVDYGGEFSVGLLGMLNGLLEEGFVVTAEMTDEETIQSFSVRPIERW